MIGELFIAVNYGAIIVCILLFIFALSNFYKSYKIHEMHILIAPNMYWCKNYIRSANFFLRKNGGDDLSEIKNDILYVNHIKNFKTMIEE